MNRRAFLHQSTLAASALAFAPTLTRATQPKPAPLFTALGVVSSLARAAELKAAGADYLVESAGNLLAPDQPEAVFAEKLKLLAASPLPVKAVNSFIRPKHLKCTGPAANHDEVLAWTLTCCQRAQRAGLHLIVFGSGGARQLPENFSKARADEQFVSLLQRMGPLAGDHNVIIAIEQLQAKECNYLNHLGEAAAVVAAAGHPNIRLNADLYHMAVMGDPPADLAKHAPLLAIVEIAEKEKRTAPGVSGDDFRPYFQALRQAGYHGPLTIEGKWEGTQLTTAFATIREQSS